MSICVFPIFSTIIKPQAWGLCKKKNIVKKWVRQRKKKISLRFIPIFLPTDASENKHYFFQV